MADQRASDADREHAAEQLRAAGGDGRLSFAELDERVEAAYGARTRIELDQLLEDVAAPHELAARTAASSGLTVRPGEGGSGWVLALLGGATREGRWRVARHCRVLNVMGGSEIDLTEAELAAEEVTITVFSLMGGNDIERGASGAGPGSGPLIRLKLISIMGGTTVRRGSKAEWRQRRRERKARRHLDRHRH